MHTSHRAALRYPEPHRLRNTTSFSRRVHSLVVRRQK